MSGAPRLPRLHLVTDDEVIAASGFVAAAARLLEIGGADLALHLRAPHACGRALYEAAAALSATSSRSGALLLVNDRVDVARAAAAGGVQLPRRGIPPAAARRLLGPGAVIGASIHSPAEADEAIEAGGADFLLAGTIFDSRSHAGVRPAGTSLISELVGAGLPVIGIGGITPDRAAEVLAAGASGIAVLSAVWHAADPERETRRFLELLQEI